MCKKVCPIAVRFSFEESELIKQQAAEEGVSVSSYIRDKIGLSSPIIKNSACHKCEELHAALALLFIKIASEDDLARFRIPTADIAKLQDRICEALIYPALNGLPE